MIRIPHLVFIVLLVFFERSFSQNRPSSAQSKVQGISISADSSFRDTENDTLELTDHVQLIFKDQHVKCDRAKINFKSKTIDAVGNVVIVNPKYTLAGARVTLDYETNTGIVYDGYVQSGTVMFEGEILYKMSENEYIADKAKYTTCSNCPESWSFTGNRIRAELGGYAYIKNSILRIGNVPIFWLPYLITPLKSDRQSGLLTPELERSTAGGVAVSESFFWAIDRSQDATFTAKNYELRGLKGLLNYRYALTEYTQGEFDTAFIKDRVFSGDSRLNQFRNDSSKGNMVSRWFIKYNHYYELPDNFIHRAQLNNASDLQYPKDFPLETKNFGDSSLENRMSLTKNTDNQHYHLDTSYNINMLQSNPLAKNEDAVHRLPELDFSTAYTNFGTSDFLYSINLTHANFARNSYAYDDLNAGYNPSGTTDRHLTYDGGPNCTGAEAEKHPECFYKRDGAFDPTKDLLRTGQRLDGRFTVIRPIQVGRADFLPKVSYNETQYKFFAGEDTTNIRRYLRAEIGARTAFNSIFRIGDRDQMKHEIQPELTYTSIPWFHHPQHAFFGSSSETPYTSEDSVSNSDVNGPYGVQFDYTDRMVDRKLMTFAVINKITRKTWSAGSPQYRQFLYWKLKQSYDFIQAERNDPRKQPLSDIASDLTVSLDRLQIIQNAHYYPYQQVINSASRVRLLNDVGDFFQIAHSNAYSVSPGQEVDPNSRSERYIFSLKKSISWLDVVGKFAYDITTPGPEANRFSGYGYGAQLRMPGECWYFTVIQFRPPGGDETYKISFDFSFDGQKKPSLSESIMDPFNF